MKRTTFYPSTALAPYIDHYLFFDLREEGQAISFKDFPRTAMDMIFFFSGRADISLPDSSRLVINNCSFISLFDSHYKVLLSQDAAALMVRFKANGIYPLTSFSMQNAVNNQFHLGDFLEISTTEIQEKIAECSTLPSKIKTLESWLLPHYQRDKLHFRLDHGLQLIEQHQGKISVKALSEALNSNYKSLDRWFLKKVGLPPKKFIQLARFKSILTELEKTEQVDWMRLVDHFGFHDQAHFTKSFKQFAGMSPTSYQTQNNQAL